MRCKCRDCLYNVDGFCQDQSCIEIDEDGCCAAYAEKIVSLETVWAHPGSRRSETKPVGLEGHRNGVRETEENKAMIKMPIGGGNHERI